MSPDTRQWIEELLAIGPWLAFLLAVGWFRILELRDMRRHARADERVSVRERLNSPSPK